MNEYKYFCEKCNYGTNHKNAIDSHYGSILHQTGKIGRKGKKEEDKKERAIVKCNKCDFETTNVNNLLTHQLNNHGTKEERKAQFKYYCDFCDFGVFSESSYNKHLERDKHKKYVERAEKNNADSKDNINVKIKKSK